MAKTGMPGQGWVRGENQAARCHPIDGPTISKPLAELYSLPKSLVKEIIATTKKKRKKKKKS